MKKVKNFRFAKAYLILASLLLTVALVFGSVTYARLIGAGYGKSIIYSTVQNFSSNVLRKGTSDTAVLKSIVHTDVNIQSISVMNYDPSNFEADEFDLVYEFRCYVSYPEGAVVSEDKFGYSVKVPGSDASLSLAGKTAASPFVYTGTLKGGQRSTDDFTISFDPVSEDIGSEVLPLGSVHVVAVPVSPLFMSNIYLGATISKSNEEFSAAGHFTDADKDLSSLIGFIYDINSYGVTAENQYVVLTWDPEVLEFDHTNRFFVDDLIEETTTDGKTYKFIKYAPKTEGENVTVTFYRTDNWGSGFRKDDEGEFILDDDDNKIPFDYDDTTPWSVLNAAVSVSAETDT